MRWYAALFLVLPPARLAHAAPCLLRATEWKQDGALRASAEGPVLARATSSPELMAVDVELGSGEPAAHVRLRDSVGDIEAWMPLSDLRLRVDQPLRFADDTLFAGQADLRVVDVLEEGLRVEPMDLPAWLRPQDALRATVACGDAGLVTAWRGDLRAVAVGGAARGARVFLLADDAIPLSRTPGTSPSLRLLLDAPIPAEQISAEVEALRVLFPLPGMLVVGWVPKESVGEPRGAAEEGAVAESAPAPATPALPLVRCKKELPLWGTVEDGDYQLGTLAAGVALVFGEKQGDRQPLLAVPDARAWAPAEGVGLWVAVKDAKSCKAED